MLSRMSESSVTLRWELPYSRKGRETAERYIRCLKAFDPKALPRRYGMHEPLKGVVENDDFSGFLDEYDRAGAAPHGYAVQFVSHHRFCAGSFSFSDPRRRGPNAKAVGLKRVRLHHSFLGKDCQTPERADRLQAIFVSVARALGAFYGIAYLETGHERHGPRLYTHTLYPLPRSTYWLGVPQVPGWMVWFGPPYAEALRSSCAGHITEEFAEGFLMRRSQLPAGLEELANEPTYPPELTARLCEQTLSGRIHSIFPPEVTSLDPRTYDRPADVLLPLD